MENFAEWFYCDINPWSSEEHLAFAAVGAFVLIFASTLAILISVYVGHQHPASNGKVYFTVAYFFAPLISLAMSLLFKWYVAAAILTVIFAAVFLSSKQKKEEFATKRNFVRFILVNIMVPNLMIIVLSLSGLPYNLL